MPRTITLTPLGKVLRKLRVDLGGLSMTQYAAEIGVGIKTLSHIETGKRNPDPIIVSAIIKHLQRQEDYIRLPYLPLIQEAFGRSARRTRILVEDEDPSLHHAALLFQYQMDRNPEEFARKFCARFKFD